MSEYIPARKSVRYDFSWWVTPLMTDQQRMETLGTVFKQMEDKIVGQDIDGHVDFILTISNFQS